jgi:hypothetical protein
MRGIRPANPSTPARQAAAHSMMAACPLPVSIRGGSARTCWMSRKSENIQKARFWRAAIREAARSGVSIREFCRQRKLRERRFYRWQRRLSPTRQTPEGRDRRPPQPASFALVGEDAGAYYAGIELPLTGGAWCTNWRPIDGSARSAEANLCNCRPGRLKIGRTAPHTASGEPQSIHVLERASTSSRACPSSRPPGLAAYSIRRGYSRRCR